MSTDLPWTIGRLLDWTTQYLQGKGIESARLEAELLLAHALGCARIMLYTRHTEEPSEERRGRFRELVKRRLEGCPVAHLLGRKEFFSMEFEVTPAVLIPRADSEWLVTECLGLIKSLSTPRVLDLGTGSGCLALAIAKQNKKAQVTAVEVSAEALGVARRNAERHGLTARVRFLQSDLYAAVPPEERFDVIVSNPPYIRRSELAQLAVEVRDHEPWLALDGGEDGFALIDRLIAETPNYLAKEGTLLIEIGYDQEEQARSRFDRAGGWHLLRTIQDGAGHPRVVRARRQ